MEITIAEQTQAVSITEGVAPVVNITTLSVPIEISTSANLPYSTSSASNVTVVPYGTLTATILQDALEQIADQSFRSTTEPLSSNVEEGDMWYNKTNESLYTYRETAPNVLEWVPILLGDTSSTSDILDGGAF
tara:strand:+ start:575 stop:973 length:399 start_codon:yes stop_codon:yes gene_type:complete